MKPILVNLNLDDISPFFESLAHGEKELVKVSADNVKKSRYVVADKDNGDIVGIAGIFIMRYLPLPNLFMVVKRDHWNKGIGFKLLRNVINYASNHYGYLFLSTLNDAGHQNAIHLYRKCGFIHFPMIGQHYWMIKFGGF
jgi:RimJ/RimL family protein N-acetyltransferase